MKIKKFFFATATILSVMIMGFTGCGGHYVYPKVQSLNEFKNIEKYDNVGIVGLSNDSLTKTSKIFFAKYLKEIGINPIMCDKVNGCEADIISIINASESSKTNNWSYSVPATYVARSNSYNYGYGLTSTRTTVTPIGGRSSSGSITVHDASLSVEIVNKRVEKTLYIGTANLESRDNPSNLIEETTLYMINDWLYKNINYSQNLNKLNIDFYENLHPDWSDGESPLYKQMIKENK